MAHSQFPSHAPPAYQRRKPPPADVSPVTLSPARPKVKKWPRDQLPGRVPDGLSLQTNSPSPSPTPPQVTQINTLNINGAPPPPPPPPPPPGFLLPAARPVGIRRPQSSISSDSRPAAPSWLHQPRLSSRKTHQQRPPISEAKVMIAQDGPFARRVKSVLDERRKLVGKRINVNNQKRDLARQLPLDRGAYDDFLKELKHMVPAILRSDVPPEIKKALQDRWAEFDNFSETLKIWHKRLEQDEDELFRYEGRLISKENDLYKSLKNLLNPGAFLDTQDGASQSSITSRLSRTPTIYSNSSTSTHTVERRYYQTIGGINLLRDQIFNLESELRLQKLQRQQQRELGQVLDPPDDQFFQEYFTNRENIVMAYCAAKAQMETLAQTCQQEGLEIEPPNLPPFLDQLFKEDEEILLMRKSKNPYATPREDRHIIRWIRGVQRASQDGPALQTETSLTDFEADKVLIFPQYGRLQSVITEPPAAEQPEGPPGRTSSFHGDPPSNGRRYSAPELPILSFRVSESTHGLDDAGFIGDMVGILSLQERGSQSVA